MILMRSQQNKWMMLVTITDKSSILAVRIRSMSQSKRLRLTKNWTIKDGITTSTSKLCSKMNLLNFSKCLQVLISKVTFSLKRTVKKEVRMLVSLLKACRSKLMKASNSRKVISPKSLMSKSQRHLEKKFIMASR